MLVDWNQFKNFTQARKIDMLMVDQAGFYYLFASEDVLRLECQLDKNASDLEDLYDFESNFKASCNPERKQEVSLNIDEETTLKVSSAPPSFNTNLSIEDMNVSTGGVPSGTLLSNNWVTLYQVNGSGKFVSFMINFSSATGLRVRLISDGVDLMNGPYGLSTSSINSPLRYDLNSVNQYVCGLIVWGNAVSFTSSLPIDYASNFKIMASREPGALGGAFYGGLIKIIKN